jgi:Holliday junction resolvase
VSQLGHNRERQVKDLLLGQDWWCIRAAGSMGDADVVAIKPGRVLFIEVKANGEGGPYMNFRPKDRADLLFAAELAGAEAWLCWWPKNGKPRWLPASEWPEAKMGAAA